MSLRPISPALRTIHNGSAFVAKANIIVQPGAELTVPEDVAEQLQRDGAFKDGHAPEPPADTPTPGDEQALDEAAGDEAAGDEPAPAKKPRAKRV